MSDRRIAIAGGFATLDARGPAGAPRVIVLPPLGIPGHVLDPFCDRLSRALEVHVVELPGTGRASGVRAGVGTRDLAAALRAVVAAERLGGAHLFGVSFGGMVAQWAAIDGPDCFDRLVLASTAAQGLRAALSGPAHKLALARALLGSEPAGVELAREIVSEHVRRDPDAMARIEAEIVAAPRAPEEVAWLAAAAIRHDARARLSSIRARTLVVRGEHDEIVPVALEDELARALGAERAVIPGAGHDVTSDQPERTAEVVERFLLAPRGAFSVRGAGG